MRSRLLAPLAAAGAAAALAPAAAPAASQTVAATAANTFSPKVTAVMPGETVTFVNRGGDHNVVWNDGGVPPTPSESVPPEQWPPNVSRTFSRTGRYRYFCEIHGDSRSDFGMVGYVYVNAAGLVPPTVTRMSARPASGAGRLTFTASRAGRATATFFRRTGARYLRFGAASFNAARGRNVRTVRPARRLTPGRYRVTVTVTDANRLRSEPRSTTFTLP